MAAADASNSGQSAPNIGEGTLFDWTLLRRPLYLPHQRCCHPARPLISYPSLARRATSLVARERSHRHPLHPKQSWRLLASEGLLLCAAGIGWSWRCLSVPLRSLYPSRSLEHHPIICRPLVIPLPHTLLHGCHVFYIPRRWRMRLPSQPNILLMVKLQREEWSRCRRLDSPPPLSQATCQPSTRTKR